MSCACGLDSPDVQLISTTSLTWYLRRPPDIRGPSFGNAETTKTYQTLMLASRIINHVKAQYFDPSDHSTPSQRLYALYAQKEVKEKRRDNVDISSLLG